MSDDPLIPTFAPEPSRPFEAESPEAIRATHIANEFTRFATEIARATRLATTFVTKVATRTATQAATPDPPAAPDPHPPAAPVTPVIPSNHGRAKTTLGEAAPATKPAAKTRVKTAIAEPRRARTVFSEPEVFYEPDLDDSESEPELEPEPESELPINTTPTLLERSMALAEVGAEWVGALTQAAVQQAASNFDHELALKKERDARQYHLVAVKGKQSGEYLYVSGAEADEIEKRLRREGWRVLRTPIS